MSALTEQVAREHDYFDTPKGRQCRCGARPPRGVEMIAWHREHIAEVTEAATLAVIAHLTKGTNDE